MGLTSRKSRKLFGRPRGLQVVKVESPLGDQGANKSQKSQALWRTKGQSRKGRKPLGDQGLESGKSRKPFENPRGLQVARPKRMHK